ncbi:hypothetical protein HPC49_23160 [Pyxidicoccus fallax]|uniref:Uncharacterized protein n=1 Tax=Pyxidicoccus fallax TaxID=394095 RepID=A0A848LR12_9BACT|nr:hypothetical protein [Pyxidicoccus fallax]NMO20337.1 hypothetical protein [Pyxidicoccus fallax]NPC81113.1 hypothetical protein [Pyxidicoccus fallax]
MFNSANIQTGMVVRDRDGERLGTVSAVDAGGFFIGKGSHFLRDYRVAFSDVMDLDNDDLYLRDALADLPGPSTGMSVTARSEDRPLQHDLTGGLGVAPQGGLEQTRTDGAMGQMSGGLGVAPQGGLEQPPSQDAGQMRGGLGLNPRDLEQARMDSAKFQDHGQYDVGAESTARPAATGRERRSEDLISDVDPAVVAVRQPPVVVERRAALDEDEAPRRDAPSDFDPNTRR